MAQGRKTRTAWDGTKRVATFNRLVIAYYPNEEFAEKYGVYSWQQLFLLDLKTKIRFVTNDSMANEVFVDLHSFSRIDSELVREGEFTHNIRLYPQQLFS